MLKLNSIKVNKINMCKTNEADIKCQGALVIMSYKNLSKNMAYNVNQIYLPVADII